MFLCLRKCLYQRDVPPNGFFSKNFKRMITSSEIATALRPFYFVVHPDLFGRHPQQRTVNEDSLKHLSAHLEAVQQQRIYSVSPRVLTFYLRDSDTEKRTEFKLVKIHLDRSADTKEIIRKILATCCLPTDFVDRIKSMPKVSVNRPSRPDNQPSTNDTFYGTESEPPFDDDYEMYYQKIHRAKQERTLKAWLNSNITIAQTRSAALDGLRQEVDKLEKSIAKRLKLKDLQYDCGWNVEHYRGCLKSLESMAIMNEADMRSLEGRILVFAPQSGVSLEGHIMLFTGDVQRNWLDFIKNISKHDEYLQRIPSYESALSQVLRDIKIARRKFMPKAQAIHYAAQLRKVTTAMLDFLTTRSYPKCWPASLKDYELVIESEAGPLMVSPTGQLIAPSTCPGSILVDFLTNHLDEAAKKAEDYNKNKHIEKELHARCVDILNLGILTKDDSIDPNKMIATLERLLKTEINCSNISLHITHYYSVLSDGTVCIPWDWTLE